MAEIRRKQEAEREEEKRKIMKKMAAEKIMSRLSTMKLNPSFIADARAKGKQEEKIARLKRAKTKDVILS